MVRAFISNKQFICIICIVIVIYLLYLGYKFINSNKEGFGGTYTGKWDPPQTKSCIGNNKSQQDVVLKDLHNSSGQRLRKDWGQWKWGNTTITGSGQPTASINAAAQYCFQHNCGGTAPTPAFKSGDTATWTGGEHWGSPWIRITRNSDSACEISPATDTANAHWGNPDGHNCSAEPGKSMQNIVLDGLNNPGSWSQTRRNDVINWAINPSHGISGVGNINPALIAANGDTATQSGHWGGYHHGSGLWVLLTRFKDVRCSPHWNPPWQVECLPTKDGPGNVKFWAEIKNIMGGALITSQEDNAKAIKYCQIAGNCPNTIVNNSSVAAIYGNDKPYNAYNRHGWAYKSYIDAKNVPAEIRAEDPTKKCKPYWGEWKTECRASPDGLNWPAQKFAKLENCGSDCSILNAPSQKIAAVQACINNPQVCGNLPAGYSDAEGRDAAVIGPHVVAFSSNESECKPRWQTWTNKSCVGMGASQQKSQLALPAPDKWPDIGRASAFPPGPINHLNTNAAGEAAVLGLCSQPGQCDGYGAPTPEYDTEDPNTTFTYKEVGIGGREGIITKYDDSFCYPTWQKWSGKHCIGYKKGKNESQITIGADRNYLPKPEIFGLDGPAGRPLKIGEGADFCLRPENWEKCSGPSITQQNYDSELNVPYFDPEIDTTVGFEGLAWSAWGKVLYNDDTELCQPGWANDAEKKRARYGIAQYSPKVKFKPGGVWNADISDCEAQLADVSYTSIDDFTWADCSGCLEQELCKGDSCWPASFIKECTSPASIDGLEEGQFIRRDAEYAGMPTVADLIPWNWGNTYKGAKQYYWEGPKNIVPSGDGGEAAANPDDEKGKKMLDTKGFFD